MTQQKKAPVAKRHPCDGKKRFDYIESKIDHMLRKGNPNAGYGTYGGAAVDKVRAQ